MAQETIPPFLNFLKYLEVDEMDFIRHTQATYKLGVQFCDWLAIGKSYMYPFGSIGVRIDGKDFFSAGKK